MVKDKAAMAAKKVTTPKFRVSFPKLWHAESFEGGEPKYSITMLFDKKTNLSALKKAARAAAVEAHGADEKKWPKKYKMPFRDGSEKEDLEGYEGNIFVFASCKQPPGVVDQQKNEITEHDRKGLYAGCYARATLIAFDYNTAGNRGVSFALLNVQKWADGEEFSGRVDAADEFEEINDDGADDTGLASDDDSNDEVAVDPW